MAQRVVRAARATGRPGRWAGSWMLGLTAAAPAPEGAATTSAAGGPTTRDND